MLSFAAQFATPELAVGVLSANMCFDCPSNCLELLSYEHSNISTVLLWDCWHLTKLVYMLPYLQAFPSEPQPAERAESPPTPVAPPASYFHSREPLQSMATSHITVSAAPPLPPAPAPVLTVGPPPGQQVFGGFAPARVSRAPAFPAHLRPAVASLQVRHVCFVCNGLCSMHHAYLTSPMW